MKEVVTFLRENPVQYLATIDLEGKPSVCPFEFILEDQGKLWFYTNSEKDVCKHMKKNPDIELCTCNNKNQWIRISGKAKFSDDKSIKEKIFKECDFIKSMFKSVDDPEFEVFYIDDGKATIYDHQNGTKEYDL